MLVRTARLRPPSVASASGTGDSSLGEGAISVLPDAQMLLKIFLQIFPLWSRVTRTIGELNGSQSVVLEPSPSVSCGNLLEMKIWALSGLQYPKL